MSDKVCIRCGIVSEQTDSYYKYWYTKWYGRIFIPSGVLVENGYVCISCMLQIVKEWADKLPEVTFTKEDEDAKT